MNTNNFILANTRVLLNKHPGSRPFICKGKPIKNQSIFIVGYNAATKLERDFIDDWNDETGFDYETWIEEYIKERKNSGKRNTLSNTRLRLKWITENLAPLHTIETNIFNIPTANVKELTNEQKNSEIFESLIQELNPRYILIHGKDALKNFNRIYEVNLTTEKIETITINRINTIVNAVKHFSRGWSQVAIENLTKEIKLKL